MPVINKPSHINKVWSSGGDLVKPSDSKINTGWEIEIPPRQWFNWIDNKQDQAIAHFNQFGIPVWDGETEYQSGRSYTQGPTNGIIYRALQTHTNQNPELDSSGTYWEAWNGTGGGGDEPEGGTVPVGAVVFVASNATPTGYLKANGAAVNRTVYSALFNAIGTTYGAGDGTTTFNLPDLRGEFIRGWADNRDVDAGRALGSTQAGAFQSHTHTATTATAGSHSHSGSTSTDGGHTHTYAATLSSGSPGAATGNGYTNQSQNTSVSGSHNHSVSISSSGAHTHDITVTASGGAETRPRNIAMLALIKY